VTDVLNPVEIEQAIRTCSDRIAASVKVCSERYAAFLDANRSYDQAFAHAYLDAGGAAHERKYAAEVATGVERELRDRADASYKYADRQAKALELELRAYQSLGASVRSMYAVTGVGVGR
jgi:hypothetical protein